jgi:hypothetical protein
MVCLPSGFIQAMIILEGAMQTAKGRRRLLLKRAATSLGLRRRANDGRGLI